MANRGGGLPWKVPIFVFLGLLFAAPPSAGLAGLWIYRSHARTVPAVPDLAAHKAEAPRTSRFVAQDGTILAEIPFHVGEKAGHRTWVEYRDLPRLVVNALLAAEDVRFFAHDGVDPRAVIRAAWANYRAGETVEGASTITQQVARSLLPEEIGRERTLRRKIREAILARRIERTYDKELILETYANHVFLGAGAYGVLAAARTYFDKDLDELTLPEAALIAGMAQAPGRTNPYESPEAATARRNEVLARMARADFASPDEVEAARRAPLGLRRPPEVYGTRAAWITEAARREVADALAGAYARGGLVVETTALPSRDAELEAIVVDETDRVGRRTKRAPEAALIAFDVRTRYVEALVGGRSFARSQFNRATQACRQPGSAFKPLVYAAALERDVITPATLLRDAPISVYDDDLEVYWKPTNSGRSFAGAVLAQDALARSLNAPAVDVLDRVGIESAVAMARRLGLSTRVAPVRPLVLGASCVIPAELASAFGVFATGGRHIEPVVVTRVVDRGEIVVDRAAPEDPFLSPARRLDRVAARLGEPPEQVLDAPTAYLMADMLRSAVVRGTGSAARRLDRPVAGKTGTTNSSSDAWFVGFSSRVVLAVWVGHDDPSVPLGRRESGSETALPLWMAALRRLEAGRTPGEVPGPPPKGVSPALIDPQSGLLARPGTPGRELYFRDGTAPRHTAGELWELPQDVDRLTREF